MRKEQFFVGDIIHAFNRGNRKQQIVRDKKDRIRFLQMLYYFNDEYSPSNLFLNLNKHHNINFYNGFERSPGWPKQNPLVKILAFVLMDNHYHLILEEIKEGGIAKFMLKLGTGTTNRFNTRHKETGRLFQGTYKARRVDRDNYLRYLAIYIQVKNVFELYPGGIQKALKNFNDAYAFALKYSYNSLSSYTSNEVSPIVDTEMLKEAFPTQSDIKEFAKECINFIYFDEKNTVFSVENNSVEAKLLQPKSK